MDFDFNEIMRQVWADTKETDCPKAAKYLLKQIPPENQEEILLELLAEKWSSYMARISRAQPLDKEKMRRHNPAINPRTIGRKVLQDLDERPFFVPSLGFRVSFRDMTAEHWNDYSRYRRERARGYEASAQWGDLNADKLKIYAVQTSGELPPEVKHELFAALPDE